MVFSRLFLFCAISALHLASSNEAHETPTGSERKPGTEHRLLQKSVRAELGGAEMQALPLERARSSQHLRDVHSAPALQRAAHALTAADHLLYLHKSVLADSTPADTASSDNSTKKEKEEDDEQKVKLGIDVASDEERSHGILRCLESNSTESHAEGVDPVSVGIYLLNLGSEGGGLEKGVFFADFLFYLQQKGRPYSGGAGSDPLQQFMFSNAKTIESRRKIDEGIFRIRGHFFFSPDLRWFPFDTEDLEIVIEQMRAPISAWEFESSPALNGMSTSLRFPGWQSSIRGTANPDRANCRTHVSFKVYPTSSGTAYQNMTYSRFVYEIKVTRPFWQGVLMKMLPPLVMLLPTIVVFLLDPLANTPTKISLCSGSLVTIILFHASETSPLPPLSYLTLFDKFIFCYYLTVLHALLCVVTALVLFRETDGVDAVKRPYVTEHLRMRQRGIVMVTTPMTYLVFLPTWALFADWQILPLAAYALLLGAFMVWLVVSTRKLARGTQNQKDELSSLISRGPNADSKKSVESPAASTGSRHPAHLKDPDEGMFSCGP